MSGFKQGRLLDANVTLQSLSHEFPPVLDVLLQAPNGRRAIIMADAGGNQIGVDVTNITLTLDDQAAASLPQFSRLGAGRFKPTNNDNGPDDFFPPPAPAGTTDNVRLATFTGINPNGIWRLFVNDELDGFTGSFGAGWSLTIKARVRV